jgi:hypothetical protein
LLIEHKVYPAEANALVAKYVPQRPQLYDLGFMHNNCGGMCVRAGQGQFNHLLVTRPEFYAEQEDRNEWAREEIAAGIAERIANGTYNGDPDEVPNGGFIRVTLDGDLHYLHMKEFRELVQAGIVVPPPYDIGGCGCFVDDAPVRRNAA